MLVHLGDGPAQTSFRAATLSQKLQIKLSISPCHNTVTPVPALTLSRQASGRVATGVPRVQSLASLHPEKSPGRNRESNRESAAPEEEALNTRRWMDRECLQTEEWRGGRGGVGGVMSNGRTCRNRM